MIDGVRDDNVVADLCCNIAGEDENSLWLGESCSARRTVDEATLTVTHALHDRCQVFLQHHQRVMTGVASEEPAIG